MCIDFYWTEETCITYIHTQIYHVVQLCSLNISFLWNRCTNRKSNLIPIGRNEMKIYEYPIGNGVQFNAFRWKLQWQKNTEKLVNSIYYEHEAMNLCGCVRGILLQNTQIHICMHSGMSNLTLCHIKIGSYNLYDVSFPLLVHSVPPPPFLAIFDTILIPLVLCVSLYDLHSIHVPHWQSAIILVHNFDLHSYVRYNSRILRIFCCCIPINFMKKYECKQQPPQQYQLPPLPKK